MRPSQFIDGSRLRLNTTIRLRWFAVAGQLITILTIYHGFGFPLPYFQCLGVILLSALLNIGLSIRYPRAQRLVSRHAMLLLCFDILQLAALLALTGGLENPFAFLMVVPVAVSASTQPLPTTAFLAGIAVVLGTLLARYHLPLPWAHGAPPVLPLNYMIGLWFALVSCIIFIAFYAWRIGQEARQMSQALTAAELVLAREQKLSALDGLAAAAAHQLGTPLSTIALVAKELDREVPKDSPFREDIALLLTEARRCRDILGELSRSGWEGEEEDHIFSQMRLSHIVEEVVSPLRSSGVNIEVRMANGASHGKASSEPVLARNPGLIHSLFNLVENAVDFAREKVTIDAVYDQSQVSLKIADDGPGFPANIINHLGEPYVKGSERREEGETGMGLGFFIAKTLLERSGASISVNNKPLPESGAIVEVSWPRQRLERISSS